MAKAQPKREGPIRCAIYCRKSTEEGLEQEFNSLDAQREACAAYIVSQKHEGWAMLPDCYDDGGFSGGSMDRPALKLLLAAVAARKVDVIVVYKVDRLTRSLADFAKIVDVLDNAQASFVSVTQAFNTTTSMGRLTLNVLLSFAQFEREVTSERIRDKFAASKKKGIWMGGVVPLGYDVIERKLVPNEGEAATVRHIFTRYLELGSTAELADELAGQGIYSKARPDSARGQRGSRPFSRGALAHLLKNRVFIGEIGHKGQYYAGEQQPIIESSLFEAVLAMTKSNTRGHRLHSRGGNPSVLAGLLTDAEGRKMRPSHATKGARRYRYYITAPATPGGKMPGDGWRVPSGELEPLIQKRLGDWLRFEADLIDRLASLVQPQALAEVLRSCVEMADRVERNTPVELRDLLLAIDARVSLATGSVTISFSPERLIELLGAESIGPTERCSIEAAAFLVRRGSELRLAFTPNDQSAPTREDVRLIGLIAKAETAYDELLGSEPIERIRRAHLTRMARLKFLAPDIITAIVDGRQPAHLSARSLLRVSRLPITWSEQREMLGFC